jgi:hypothetical protein
MSTLQVQDGQGYYGLIDRSRLDRVSFPVPDLEQLPTVYDLRIVDDEGERVFDHNRFDNGSIQLGKQLIDKPNYFYGESAQLLLGEPLLLHPGSPSHANLRRYRYDRERNLMIPSQLGRGSATHDPGDLFLAVLQDVGWQIR